MAVENTTNIAGLDDTLPTGTDTKSEGDNHLRLLKTVLKHVFAGFPGEVLLAATEAQGATVNDYVLSVAPAPAAYATYTTVVFRANHANTGAATLKVGGLAAKALVNPEGSPLRANAITATTWVLAVYDGTNFRMIGGGNSQAIYDYADQLAFQAALPGQAGNAGKYLRTNGTAASWMEALPRYAANAIPTADEGLIVVAGIGVMEWDGSTAYKPLAMQQWTSKALGEPFYLRDDLPGVASPPNTIQGMRFIKLTASDAYNTGLLTGESVIGSAPLVVATAVINLAGSPINGATVNLINTERRMLRAGAAGAVENDALQNITGSIAAFYRSATAAASGALSMTQYATTPAAAGSGSGDSARITFDASTVARTSTETRSKNQGVTAYMRIL
ncbi:hypothetical protein P3W70_06985 [Achromobacter denitrificans]|uniref:hypothetical protein n=1 Tax=Achromobacter denitrificans TaxID=32002 RepID=UPI0023E8D312|nr:hypothetical protein [Achromobacter denitrificans]MDF3858083.1 hypothetical protein [Achromobacter denitrificans]